MSKLSHGSEATGHHVLVVGGDAAVQLAWCRLLGRRGLRVSLLRWGRQRSAADASRFCHRSVWLGSVDDGVAAWRQAFENLLRDDAVTDVLPVDALALALVCDGRLTMPANVKRLGPDQPSTWATATDRLGIYQMAQASGWTVLPWLHVTQIDAALPSAVPLVVRPRWNVRLVDDEPARFSTKRVADQGALDAKLRDDVPRGEVLVQAPTNGHVTRICLAAREGQVLGSWLWPIPLQTDEGHMPWQASAAALIARLGWTGLIELEAVLGNGGPLLVDLHYGGREGFASLVQGGAPASGATSGATGSDVLAAIASSMSSRGGAIDPLPQLAWYGTRFRSLWQKLAVRTRASWMAVARKGEQPLRLAPTQSILIVCKGNINRSVVAEQLLKSAGFTRTMSAALLGLSGRRPSRPAEAYLAESLAIRPGTLRSQSLRQAIIAGGPFDVVLCFERRHLVEIAERCPNLSERVQLISALAPALGGPTEIADPHGGSAKDHRACFDRIRATLEAAIAGGPANHACMAAMHLRH